MMAKSEGGLGLDEGIVNFDLLAQFIHFQINQNSGVVYERQRSNQGDSDTNGQMI